MEDSLGELPPEVRKIRELITGFEVCHFKLRVHIARIRESIEKLEPFIELQEVGRNHMRHGEKVLDMDGTGRSSIGQKYVKSLKGWLAGDVKNGEEDYSGDRANEVAAMVKSMLGEKDPEKERLVRLLVARLLWDWDSYGELTGKDENKELEFQACRMDICHYAFPGNMKALIEGIGKLEPVENFEGCGSVDPLTREYIDEEFRKSLELMRSCSVTEGEAHGGPARAWLYACLAKTIKEQGGLARTMEF